MKSLARILVALMLVCGGGAVLHGCNGDSPTAQSTAPVSGWVKETGTIGEDFLLSSWASPSGLIYMTSAAGEMVRFDGKTWEKMPRLSGRFHLFGFSDRDMFGAAGGVYHFDGREWMLERVSPGPGVTDIWGTDPGTMFGVGYGGYVFRRVGDRWEGEQSPTTRELVAMWGASSRRIFAVGGLGRIISYDGKSWRNVESNTDYSLNDIWGRSANDVYAVGQYATITHFDGTSWERIPVAVQDHFQGVWGDDSSTYIVGLFGVYELRATELVHVFGGPDNGFATVVGSSRAGIVASGSNGVTAIKQHGQWASTFAESRTQYTGASMAADGTLFVTGYNYSSGGFVRSRLGDEPWSDRSLPVESVETIWAADHDHAFGLRNPGGVHRLIGSTWDFLPVPGMEFAYRLTGFDASHIVVVVDSLARWFDGSDWTTREIAAGFASTDVWGTSPDNLYVTSYDGRVFEWIDSSWQLLRQFGSAYAITGTSDHDIWVAEYELQLHHFNGQDWTDVQLEPGHIYTGIQLLSISPNDVFMIGRGGDVVHFDGTQWRMESTPPCAYLTALAGRPGTDVIAVGHNSALLRLNQ